MKTLRFLSILSLVFTITTGYAQKVKIYKVWVTLVNQKQVNGTLYAANEDELVVLGEDLTQMKFVPENIQAIKLRREGNVGKGAWIGALGGLAVGSIAGYASESGSGWEDVGAVGGGILGAPIGTLIGLAVSSGKTKYQINGNKDTYNSFLPKLQQYAP
ncbi:hypothetical protein ACOCEA_03350 [Maribacter sp. CXY002]|uniref:hypothetical protein n=1 Tax=Maribacter luteocoastalis TaxID=3407671 RepID=UPI003B683CDE